MPVLAATNYRITDLGTLAGGTQSVAHGVNSLGWVVGTADTADGNFHAFLATGGPLLDLGTLGGKTSTSAGVVQDLLTLGGRNSSATGINAAGQVVGNSDVSGGAIHAFLHTGGGLQDLGTLGGRNSFAKAINSAGQIVGKSGDAGGATHAFLYNGPMQSLNSLLPSGSGWE